MTSYHPEPTGAADRLALRRAAPWALLGARLVGLWGVRWDIQWHGLVGRETARGPQRVLTLLPRS